MTEKIKGISGSMFAGKTDMLIEVAIRAEYAKKKVLAFKPSIDNRWNAQDLLVSRKLNGEINKTYPAIAVKDSHQIAEIILNKIESKLKPDYIIIDEVQLFDEEVVDVILFLAEADIKVVFAGLATDFRGEPFGPMPTLLAIADEIDRITAICNYEDENGRCCGKEATRTQRFLSSGEPADYYDPIVVIGSEEYKARCPHHHIVPNKPKLKI